jgi:60 kDa SS-A/Ro ribonucleoprotein
MQKFVSKKQTPQTEQALPRQVKNRAGGYVFQANDWEVMQRFLILGTEGSTYYATEKEMTLDACKRTQACIDQDGQRAVRMIVDVSKNGRAPKNDPAIYSLALCLSADNVETKQAAEKAVLEVCRTGTHILHLCEYLKGQRGWGRIARRALARWYGTRSRTPEDLAYQLLKYRQRDAWSHRDAIRLSHPVSSNPVKRALFEGVVKDWDFTTEKGSWKPLPAVGGMGLACQTEKGLETIQLPRLVQGYLRAKTAANEKELIQLVKEFGLPREMLPTEALTPKVWGALLEHSTPMTAMIRNLGNFTKHGLLNPLSEHERLVISRLTNPEAIQKARVHPIQVLAASRTYAQGHGMRGKSEWDVNTRILDALDQAFEHAFKCVEPTGKRIQVAIDVSGSMGAGQIAGVPGLTPRTAAAAMAMIFARTERDAYLTAFSGGHPHGFAAGTHQFGHARHGQNANPHMEPITLTGKTSLALVEQALNQADFGATDCALPMLYAMAKQIPTDVFLILTDNETWAGPVHVHQALQGYRNRMNLPRAKLVAIAMTATSYSICDETDPNQLSVVGFDTAVPQILREFILS